MRKLGPWRVVSRRSLLVVVAVVVASTCAVRHAQHDALARSLSVELDTQIAALEAARWERPVLRGTALDGNAALAEARVLEELLTLPEAPIEALIEPLCHGGPLPDEARALARTHRAALERLRAATGSTSAYRPSAHFGAWEGSTPSFEPRRRAGLLLLALAVEADAPGAHRCVRARPAPRHVRRDRGVDTGHHGAGGRGLARRGSGAHRPVHRSAAVVAS